MTDPIAPPTRRPFQEETQERAKEFAQYILTDVPELESVAVIFSYSITSPDLPYAVVMGQLGSLRHPAEIMHMSEQLWKTLNFQLTNGYECVKKLDGFMAEQGQKLKELQEQIDAKQHELDKLNNHPGD